MALNDPGIKDEVGRVAVVPTTHQIVLPSRATAAVDIDASKSVPGQKRKNYLNKAIATSMATVMGKLVNL